MHSCVSKCIDRKLDLTNMFLGPITAKLIAKWIIHEQIEITHLILA